MARLNRQFNYLMLAFLVLNILIKSIGARFFFDYSYSFSPFFAIFAKFGRVLSTIYISRVALSWSYTTSHVLNMCSNGVWIYNEASQICQPTKNVFFAVLWRFSQSERRRWRRAELLVPFSRSTSSSFLFTSTIVLFNNTHISPRSRASIWGSDWIESSMTFWQVKTWRVGDGGERQHEEHSLLVDVVYKPSSAREKRCSEQF